MAHKAPGKHFRRGMTLAQLFRKFPDDEAAYQWFVEVRWGDGDFCPHCGSMNVQSGAKHKTMPYRCRDCRKRFSVRTGTAMEGSNLGYQVWAIAIYLLTTSLKGVSSMKLHRDLGITQKSAWHLAHRIRKAWNDDAGPLPGPVEIDETYIGGKRHNMSNAKRKTLKGRGAVGKSPVVGIKDRESNFIVAHVTPEPTGKVIKEFLDEHVEDDAKVYTDEAGVYRGVENRESVKHKTREWVDGEAHTNGIESFWSMFKRAHKGTYHKMSPKHLDRYVSEFVGRHNQREADTATQMAWIARGLENQRLKYADLIA